MPAGDTTVSSAARSDGAPIRTEVCVESLDGVRIAIEAGADRVELCTALDVDGLTPPVDLIEDAVAAAAGTGLAVHVLIRCRAGNFVYDEDEIAVMAEQVRMAVRAGADGVVIGALTGAGAVDVQALDRWILAADGQKSCLNGETGSDLGGIAVRDTSFDQTPSITFHRAFDQATDPLAALAVLADAGVDRILTSGQAPTAPQGAELLAQLVARSGRQQGPARPTVLAGGGIRPENVAALISGTGVTEVHFSGRTNGAIDAAVVRETVAAARAWR